MEERYCRNLLYVSQAEQTLVKSKRIFLGGAGIGSIIAECAVRFGFEKITIVDGDIVEESNLNRQNYCQKDIGRYKAEVLSERLLSINPHAEIKYFCKMITHDNVVDLLKGHDFAINALDFKTNLPFVFDDECRSMGIPVLHPYNFGWAGFLTIVHPQGETLSAISDSHIGFELKMAEYATQYCSFWQDSQTWLENVIQKYREEKEILPPPQLSIGSWISAGYCVSAMFRLSTGQQVRFFPKFYMSSIFA